MSGNIKKVYIQIDFTPEQQERFEAFMNYMNRLDPPMDLEDEIRNTFQVLEYLASGKVGIDTFEHFCIGASCGSLRHQAAFYFDQPSVRKFILGQCLNALVSFPKSTPENPMAYQVRRELIGVIENIANMDPKMHPRILREGRSCYGLLIDHEPKAASLLLSKLYKTVQTTEETRNLMAQSLLNIALQAERRPDQVETLIKDALRTVHDDVLTTKVYKEFSYIKDPSDPNLRVCVVAMPFRNDVQIVAGGKAYSVKGYEEHAKRTGAPEKHRKAVNEVVQEMKSAPSIMY